MKIILRVPKPLTMDGLAAELVRQVVPAVLGAEADRLEPSTRAAMVREAADRLDEVMPGNDSLRDWQRLVVELGILLGARLAPLVGPEREVTLYAADLPAAITAALEPYLESRTPPEPELRHGMLSGLFLGRSPA